MFDNVAFEVVIGLVFIYLLYSLLATIVGEIIATACGIRQRLLRIAIERMFNDGYYNKIERALKNKGGFFNDRWLSIKGWFRKVMLYEPAEFKNSFAGKFYDYPAIKYLGRIEDDHKSLFTSTKPAYITPKYFADTVVNFLRDKGSGATDMDRIGFCLKFNTYHIQPKTLKQFRNLYENAANDLAVYKQNLMDWFNETMDRNNGWYKRKMRFVLFWLGILLAIGFNIDSIRIAKILANDKEARGQLVSMGIELSKDSAGYNDFVSGNGDTVHSKAVLDSGVAHVTKDINAANLVLGLGWHFDTLRKQESFFLKKDDDPSLFKKLSYKISWFDALQKEKVQLTNGRQERFYSISLKKDSIQLLVPDTLFKADQIALTHNNQKLKDDLKVATDSINAVQKRIISLLIGNKIDSFKYCKNIEKNEALKTEINKITKSNFLNISQYKSSEDGNIITISGVRKYTGCEKFWHFFPAIFCKFRWLGFLITALALCLGAPFWFGVLNKLVSIRGVGVNPDEKKDDDEKQLKESSSNIDVLTKPSTKTNEPVGDVIDAALIKYAAALKKIPGVKSIFSVVKNGTKQLQINVDNATTKTEVNRQFPSLVVGNVQVPVLIVESGIPKSNIGEKGLIANKSGKNGFGSIGCILKRTDTGSKHILSCWHVLKGDLNYSQGDDEPFIIDHETGNDLAERWAGGIRDKFDYGLAICNAEATYQDNSFLIDKLKIPPKQKIDSRFVSQTDIDKQIPIKYYDSLNEVIVNGIIYTSSNEVDINYIDKTRTIKDVLILTDENEKTISKEGNSGSIVFDSRNKAIAMIIAGDKNYTYAVKLSSIFDIHTEMKIF